MLTVLLVWEQGAGLGHVTRLKVIADRLLSAGHRVHLALKDIDAYARLYSDGVPTALEFHQSPLWPARKLRLSREPVNLSELMLVIGYHKVPILTEHLSLWQELLYSVKPDAVVYDYAPTANLASRNLNCPKISLHTPFSSPPAVSPIPSFQREEKVSSNNLVLSDKKFVQVVNQALNQKKIPSIEKAYEAFETNTNFLMTIPELDMFAPYREQTCYLGAVETLDEGQKSNKVKTSGKGSKKIFAYLKTDYPNLEIFLKVIANEGFDATVFVPACPQRLVRKFGKNIEISSKPVCMNQILSECDLVVCHGGHSTVLHSIVNGVPVLAIPLHQEQLMTAHCVVDNQLGLGLAPTIDDEQKIKYKIADLLDNPKYKSETNLLRERYQELIPKAASERIVQAVEQTL